MLTVIYGNFLFSISLYLFYNFHIKKKLCLELSEPFSTCHSLVYRDGEFQFDVNERTADKIVEFMKE